MLERRLGVMPAFPFNVLLFLLVEFFWNESLFLACHNSKMLSFAMQIVKKRKSAKNTGQHVD
jgi:hypothetical protein